MHINRAIDQFANIFIARRDAETRILLSEW